MTLFIAGENTEIFTQRSLICSMPVMEAPLGAAVGSAPAGVATVSEIAVRNKRARKRMPVFRIKIVGAVTGGLCGAARHRGNGDAPDE